MKTNESIQAQKDKELLDMVTTVNSNLYVAYKNSLYLKNTFNQQEIEAILSEIIDDDKDNYKKLANNDKRFNFLLNGLLVHPFVTETTWDKYTDFIGENPLESVIFACGLTPYDKTAINHYLLDNSFTQKGNATITDLYNALRNENEAHYAELLDPTTYDPRPFETTIRDFLGMAN